MFFEAFCSDEYVSIAFSVTLYYCEENISSTIKCSYISLFLADQKADVFAASLLILFCNFWYLILLESNMISFYACLDIYIYYQNDLNNQYYFAVYYKTF